MVLFTCECVRNEASRSCLLKRRDLIRQESGVKGGDSLQFSGKLTASQHLYEDIYNLAVYCPVGSHGTYGNVFFKYMLCTGSR